jgi:hypothetical protein
MSTDQTKDNLTSDTVAQDDNAYVMERFGKEIQNTGHMILMVTLGGLVVAMLSVFANLGIIDLTKIKYGDVEIVLKKLFFVRLFLTSVSIGCAVAIAYHIATLNFYQQIVEFLAREKKYKRAMIMMEFRQWGGNTNRLSTYQTFRTALFVMIGSLLLILPFGTFIFSIFSG